MTNSDGYNINTFLIIVNIVNQVTTISDMLQRESGNQVVTQIWECVSTMVRIGYPDILLEIWVSEEAQWVVRNPHPPQTPGQDGVKVVKRSN